MHQLVASDPASSRAEGLAVVVSVANQGFGVARANGKVVFLPLTAPGDRVAYRIQRDWGRYALGSVIEILESGPGRVTPLCTLFGLCGGCLLQHLSYETQRVAKRQWVEDALRRIGKVSSSVDEVRASPSSVAYRNKASIHIHGATVGFLKAGSHEIVDVPICPILEPPLQGVWATVREWAGSMPQQTACRVTLRAGANGHLLAVVHARGASGIVGPLAEALPNAQVVAGGARASIAYECRGILFDVEADTFFQINTSQLDGMVGALEGYVPEGGVLLDGHAGVGWPSLCLAGRHQEVLCIELSRRSCELGIANAKRARAHTVRFRQGTLRSLAQRGRLPPHPDAVVLDPPRVGLLSRDLETVGTLQAPTVVYISCDPATQARDIRALTERGYGLDHIVPFDLFPHTAHVESIALLTLRR